MFTCSKPICFSIEDCYQERIDAAVELVNKKGQNCNPFNFMYSGALLLGRALLESDRNTLMPVLNDEALKAAKGTLRYEPLPSWHEEYPVFREGMFNKEGRTFYDLAIPPQIRQSLEEVAGVIEHVPAFEENLIVYGSIILASKLN